MSSPTVYEIHILHNVVVSIRRVEAPPDQPVPETPLDVSARLAANHRLRGCTDGRYLVTDPEHARTFAVLALDFVKRVIERRISAIESLDTGAEFDAHGGDAG